MKKRLSIIGGACVAVALCFSVQSCMQTDAENPQEQSVSLSEADLLVASPEFQEYLHFFERQSLILSSNYDKLSETDKQRLDVLLTAHRNDPSGDYLTEASLIVRYDLESGFDKLEEFRSKVNFPEGITREDIVRAIERHEHLVVTTRGWDDPIEIDHDGDGKPDVTVGDWDGDGKPDLDNDGDGYPDWFSGDTDHDGIPDYMDQDKDNDGWHDDYDDDDDNDGWNDNDKDHDGWDDRDKDYNGFVDTDNDGNGFVDTDNDGDGLPNDRDDDDDNDGWKDNDKDRNGYDDKDNDGNGLDDKDNNGNGIPDEYENNPPPPPPPSLPPSYPPHLDEEDLERQLQLALCKAQCRAKRNLGGFGSIIGWGTMFNNSLIEYMMCTMQCDMKYRK